MAREVQSGDDRIDSRDVIARLREVDDEVERLRAEDLQDDDLEMEERALFHFDKDGRDTFGSEWDHGMTLIEDSDFENYAQEFAEDVGAIKNAAQWPHSCIDWKQAARELQMDYSSVEFGGFTYWGRS